MVVRSRPHVAVAVLALAGLAVAGCSVEAEPGPTTSSGEPGTSTSASTTTATPAPGPTDWPEPDRPASMDRDDLVGAKAAAQYFIELLPYLYASGDLDHWRAMSDGECSFCAEVATEVEELHAGGGYGVGPEIEVVDVDASEPNEQSDFYVVELDVKQGPATDYGPDGEVINSNAGGTNILFLAMESRADSWTVRGVQVEGGSETP